MEVTFSGVWQPNSNFGINFEAFLSGNRISCVVSQEALQNIQPGNAASPASEQFVANQNILEAIARRLILAGRVSNGSLNISSQDLIS